MAIISDIERQMRQRLEELRPAVDEYARIEASLAALTGTSTPTRARRASAPASERPRRSQGRPSTRAAQALEAVKQSPGISVTELASSLGIGPTYLYKLMPALERDGAVRKVGKGYEPVD